MTIISTVRDVYEDLELVIDVVQDYVETFDANMSTIQNSVLAQVAFEIKSRLETWLLKLSFMPDTVTDVIKARIVSIEEWFEAEFDVTVEELNLFDRATNALQELRDELASIFSRSG